ncbi:MAG: hypothetical protein EOM88_04420 [Clostridia bacterium]|jgi:hypothetical protein|nr:hypothetical protein [Clostridia bacterium]
MFNHFKAINIKHPIWLSVSEAAKLAGVTDKTIRRGLQVGSLLKYKIIKNRYQIELGSLVMYMHRNKKLKNKIREIGLGQYFIKDRN